MSNTIIFQPCSHTKLFIREAYYARQKEKQNQRKQEGCVLKIYVSALPIVSFVVAVP